MIYKVKQKRKGKWVEQTYDGFRHYDINNKNSECIGVVWWDGEPDYWELDPDNLELAINELKRMYRAENAIEAVIHIFKYHGESR